MRTPKRPLTDAQRSVVEANRGLVYHMLNRFRITDLDAEALEHVGILALIDCAQSPQFDPSRRFSTYACRAIFFAFLAEQARQRRQRRLRVCGDALELTPTTPDHREHGEDLPMGREVWRMAEHLLTRREWYVVASRFENGLRLREIGSELGLTSERVRQILSQSLEKLRAFCGAAETEAA